MNQNNKNKLLLLLLLIGKYLSKCKWFIMPSPVWWCSKRCTLLSQIFSIKLMILYHMITQYTAQYKVGLMNLQGRFDGPASRSPSTYAIIMLNHFNPIPFSRSGIIQCVWVTIRRWKVSFFKCACEQLFNISNVI